MTLLTAVGGRRAGGPLARVIRHFARNFGAAGKMTSLALERARPSYLTGPLSIVGRDGAARKKGATMIRAHDYQGCQLAAHQLGCEENFAASGELKNGKCCLRLY